MKLPEEQVLWVAKLAQIELTEEEKHRYATDLSNVVEYIDGMASVDVSQVSAVISDNSQITGLVNVTQADSVMNCEIPRDEMLKRAPMSEGAYIKVRKVL